jgi:membrane peptidoglycan carboxypeptidase
MQLVKNVFLTRNKTVARKIEEALIVWLIENQNLVSKKRMYEVYLNLIEWGPGIYGINQASRFYFNKPPYELNLQESIYLASIVPNPKFFRYTFEVNGVPKPFFGNYFRRMEELMVRKQFIQPGDTTGVNPKVLLTGIAAAAVATPIFERDDDLILEQLDIIPAIVE